MDKILVVDDEDLIRLMMIEYLEASGYQVVVCSGGKAAISLVKDGNKFHLCILDFNIDKDYNGEELKDALYPLLPETIFFFVASADRVPQGFKASFSKPVSMPALVEAIEQALKEKKEA